MEQLTTARQRRLIADLGELVAERARSERAIRQSYEARTAATRSQFVAEQERLQTRFNKEKASVEAQHNRALATATREHEARVLAAAADHDQIHRQAVIEAESGTRAATEACELEMQRAQAAHHDAVREAKTRLAEFKEKLQTHRDGLAAIGDRAARVARRRGCWRKMQQLPKAVGRCQGPQPLERFATERVAAEASLDSFQRQWAPKCLAGPWLVVLFFGTCIAMVLAGVVGGWPQWLWITVSPVAGLGAVLILRVLLYPTVVEQTRQVYTAVQEHLAHAEAALDAARTLAAVEANAERAWLRSKLESEQRGLEEARGRRCRELEKEREHKLREAADVLRDQRQQAATARDEKLRDINARFAKELQQLQTAFDQQAQHLQSRYDEDQLASRETFERAWQRLRTRWSTGLADFQNAVSQMQQVCSARFPTWPSTDWSVHQSTAETLPLLRFGEYTLDLSMFEHGVPEHPDLCPARRAFRLPAAMSLTQHAALLLEAFGEGRAAAHRAMQNAMLRLLTSLPPGKVRFTIIDPVGLGQSFSAFMHLADFDEKLVTHRIWTDPTHIQQRLADLTEHMESVIQTYLRNQFKSIDEYNAHAGEVAEPFRILVVANFPAGFSDEAAQRLLSIVSSGARCGVYSLISTDSKLELPRNFDLADLEAHAATVQWTGREFHSVEPEIKDLPLVLDEPPPDSLLTEIVRLAGQRAKEAIRVEVPFSTVAPANGWWQRDSRAGLDVALGRAGATKLQHLQLGSGTSQHVLIAGKTGSGKSTLLHALITNTALHYGPDEVSFYLIDFKKGVEFKPYATHQLPHARVVAIESEREFGLSVLQRLDQELRQRGDLFRQAGVQDLRSYRDAHSDQVLPRILLVIDEFQEFFVQDDKLAQDASLLLDRLVRQGRAFGIHVLLGSQTLAGSYSLARSTIGQMAVRIALQCSEADSHLILSEDNTAARLLHRPGEAIYNDANGLFEGNHPFQVVWLGAGEQEHYLRQLASRARERGLTAEPALVFEGNAAADPRVNPLLQQALQPEDAVRSLTPMAWLGSPVAIKEPTSVTFRRHSGNNLLLVGQQEELALGVLGNAVIGLAATSRLPNDHAGPHFYIFDGTRTESREDGLWRRMAKMVPAGVRLVGSREVDAALQEIAREVRRRIDAGDETSAPLFCVVHNLARFRELRRGEDDYGFASLDADKPPTANQQFTEILRDGPAVGVHSLLWCDTYNNLQRWLDRQTLRDLDYRVLFQMSATDASNLMDSPAASRLGTHRALLYSEEHSEFEKFRPYSPPGDEWLKSVRQQLATRLALPAASSEIG